MAKLTMQQRERAIGMLQMGGSQRHIARTFNCTTTTINKLFQRLRQTGSTKDRPRSGRPRVTTPCEDRQLRTRHLRNRFLTVTSSAMTGLNHRVIRDIEELYFCYCACYM